MKQNLSSGQSAIDVFRKNLSENIPYVSILHVDADFCLVGRHIFLIDKDVVRNHLYLLKHMCERDVLCRQSDALWQLSFWRGRSPCLFWKQNRRQHSHYERYFHQ